VRYDHRTTTSFWDCYFRLTEELRGRADKQFSIDSPVRSILGSAKEEDASGGLAKHP